ncbi:MAG: LPS assembly lipoprotein LptE [candidate division WOR-3 bacterium]|nr:LPS assembly lipoprotein LptE [candidate division WOR-3 bacterium]MCX7837121.1 LPS assembly lipoprotein LptE [candidate division WOR-3 bacterium]MDW8113995.1 LPS assembly lipoprotein LptE [candidate division WOR-3 bacterium]
MKYIFLFLLSLILNLITFRCGYTTRIPSQIVYKKIALSFIENKTLKPMLEIILTEELENYFKNQPQIKLVNLEEAELIISGVIDNYEKKPAVYDAFQNISEWQIIISCQVKGKERDTERIIFNNSISKSLNYPIEEAEEKVIREIMKKIASEIYQQLSSQW